MLDRNNEDSSIEITLGTGKTTLGRAKDNTYSFADKTISSHHAYIYRYLDAAYIEDLDSTNGTWLCGSKVTKTTSVKENDVVKIGNLHLLVKF